MTEVKENFKNKHTNLLCPICQKDGDSQSHLMECSELSVGLNLMSYQSIKYEDIFSKSLKKQENATRLFESLFNVRKKLLENVQVRLN